MEFQLKKEQLFKLELWPIISMKNISKIHMSFDQRGGRINVITWNHMFFKDLVVAQEHVSGNT